MRTVRNRRWLYLAVALLSACGGGDDGDGDAAPGPPTTATPVAATLPDDVEPGRGAVLLGGELGVLTVTECSFEPATDDATGVTVELRIAAEDGTGRTVDVVRSSFTADAPTVTDTVRVTEPDGTVLESSRAAYGDQQIDLRVPNAVGSLLRLDDGVVRATGVFGPPDGGADDPANVDGELLLRCS
jgi:hypothetical protein